MAGMRPLLLDLFCCEGGAAMGYHRAGFDVIGIDLEPQQLYPFPMVVADALNPPFDLSMFDAIHASPPCQGYTTMSNRHGSDSPLLIDQVRAMLEASGREAMGMPWASWNGCREAVPPAYTSFIGAQLLTSLERCACGVVLDPTVFHDDTVEGDQVCEACCVTCNEEG